MSVLSCAAVDSAYSVVLTAIVCLETLLWLEFCCCIIIADYFPSAAMLPRFLRLCHSYIAHLLLSASMLLLPSLLLLTFHFHRFSAPLPLFCLLPLVFSLL
jgi:hypothetical protein